MLEYFPISTAIVASLIATWTDLRHYRIYNLLTLPLLCAGLMYSVLHSGWWGLAVSGSGAAFGFAALIGLYLAGGMGAGDVKLMAGLGAWLGPALIGDVLLTSGLAAGLYALGVLLCTKWRQHPEERSERRCWRQFLRRQAGGNELVELAKSPIRRRRLIPYGFVTLIGLLTALACSPRGPVLIDFFK